MTRRVGSAHRDGPMRATVPRKFTLVDAMALIAATGVAFLPIRLFYNAPETHPELQDSGWTLWSILLFGWEFAALSPVAFTEQAECSVSTRTVSSILLGWAEFVGKG